MAKRHRKSVKDQNSAVSHSGRLFQTISSVSNGKLCLLIAFIIIAATTVLYYPMHHGDYDVWWHLRYGSHFVSDATWNVDHGAYSWTPVDTDWKYVTWLGSSALYIIHRISGVAGLHAFLFLILVLAGLVYLAYIRLSGGRFRIVHAAYLLLAAVAVNPTAIYIKPELFTVLFFTVAVFIYFLSKRLGKNLFFLYPPLFLVWVNTHGGVLNGVIFITVTLLVEWLNVLVFPRNALDRKLLMWFTGSAALSFAALAVNPYGIGYPVETIARLIGGDKGYQNIIMAYINRWQYLFPDMYVFRRTNTAWALVIMLASFLAVNVYAYRKQRFIDYGLIAVNCVFFLFSMQMARATLFFPLIWLFSMEYVGEKTDGDKFGRNIAPMAAAAALLISGVCLWNTVTMNTYDSWFGSNIDRFVPVNEASYVRDHDLMPPLFNDYLSGGYILWALYPEYKAFIDPRHRPYEKTGVWDDYIGLRMHPEPENLRRFTEKYPFRTGLIHHVKYGDLVGLFLSSPDWRLLYIGPVAAVFVSASDYGSVSGVSAEDIGVERFADMDNPSILMSLFRIYALINLDDARQIMHIYRSNVSRSYTLRDTDLSMMSGLLTRLE